VGNTRQITFERIRDSYSWLALKTIEMIYAVLDPELFAPFERSFKSSDHPVSLSLELRVDLILSWYKLELIYKEVNYRSHSPVSTKRWRTCGYRASTSAEIDAAGMPATKMVVQKL
jgi:hypothetical protein